MREVEIMPSQDSDEMQTPKVDLQSDSSSAEKNPSFSGLFYAADKWDFFLMFFGSVGACIHGAALPVFFVLFGRMIDSLGHLSSHPHRLSSQVSKNSLYLVYLGLIVFVSSWIGVACWMQTGERQTARLRFKYLQSVLRKDIKFFDTIAKDRNILFHISSDAILVQDAIGDKIGHGLRYLAQFFVGFVVGFTSVWQLTLLTLAIVPLIAFAGGAYAMIMTTLSEKSEAAYAEAGKVAEEVKPLALIITNHGNRLCAPWDRRNVCIHPTPAVVCLGFTFARFFWFGLVFSDLKIMETTSLSLG